MISVVILNYNGKHYLDRCISSISDQTWEEQEVILVDNGSEDGSCQYVEERFPWVKIVRNNENLGFAGGMNAGISRARGEMILTLNNDTKLDRNFIKNLAEAMAVDDEIGMCASKMLFCDGRINSAGICISRSGAAWDRGMGELNEGQYDRQEEVFGPCGGAALYRRKMIEEVGLFDEEFFIYMEDVDLAFRGRLAGWKCLYVPNAVVYHVHSGTFGFGSDFSVYHGNRNIVWYPIKDFPTRLLISSLPWIVSRNLFVIPYYALRGQGRTILRSKIDAVRGIPNMLRKRKKVVRKVSDVKIRVYMRTWSEVKGP